MEVWLSLMPYTAFKTVPIQKVAHRIECLDFFGDQLLVGTDSGHLNTYDIAPNPDHPGRHMVTNSKSLPISKKPITQICVVKSDPPHLLAIADGNLHMFDLQNYRKTALIA